MKFRDLFHAEINVIEPFLKLKINETRGYSLNFIFIEILFNYFWDFMGPSVRDYVISIKHGP